MKLQLPPHIRVQPRQGSNVGGKDNNFSSSVLAKTMVAEAEMARENTMMPILAQRTCRTVQQLFTQF